MRRSSGAALVAAVLVLLSISPAAVRADVLPDRDDVYWHCTEAEQCPGQGTVCKLKGNKFQQSLQDPACGQGAAQLGRIVRCDGSGFERLYCPKDARGSFRGYVPELDEVVSPEGSGCALRRGCRR